MKASAILLTSLGSVDMTISVCLNSLFYNCQKYSSDKFSSSNLKDYLNAKAKPRENVKKTETVCILSYIVPKGGRGRVSRFQEKWTMLLTTIFWRLPKGQATVVCCRVNLFCKLYFLLYCLFYGFTSISDKILFV